MRYFECVALVLILIAGCTQLQGDQKIASCSICPAAGNWSECFDSVEKRTDYRCDSTTNFTCDSYVDSRNCTIKEQLPGQQVRVNTSVKQTGIMEFDIVAENCSFMPSNITVKSGDNVRLVVRSGDFTHDIAIPDLNVYEQLAPNSTVIIEFTAGRRGVYEFRSNAFCGSGQERMKGNIIVFPDTNGSAFIVAYPKEGELINAGDNLAIVLLTYNISIVPSGPINNQGEGHFRFIIDQNSSADVFDTAYTIRNIAPGSHDITIELVNNDGSLMNPEVKETMQFTAQQGTGCQYSNPPCGNNYNCIDNNCVLKSGCQYGNPSCIAGYVCNDNTCVLDTRNNGTNGAPGGFS